MPAIAQKSYGVVHVGILLAAVIPGAMTTSIRAAYLVTVAKIDPFFVGTFNYAASFLGIIFVYYAARRHIDSISPVKLELFALGLSIVTTLCVFAAAMSPFLLLLATFSSALSSIGASAIFAYDEQYGPRRDDNAGLFRTRLLLSIAWIVGPPASYLLFWLSGYTAVITVTISLLAVAASSMVIVSRLRPRTPKIKDATKPKVSSSIQALGFWPIFVVMVATTCANVLHSINMPLFLLEAEHAPAFWPGIVMSVAAGVEVLTIAALPKLTNKLSDELVLWAGAGLGLVYFGLLNVVTSPIAILFCQLLSGTHFAATTVVCLPLLRRALSGGTGSLAAQFNNAGRIGGLLGSMIFAILATRIGFHGILTTVCCGLLGLALIFGAVRHISIGRFFR